jgi:hypothetical protein
MASDSQFYNNFLNAPVLFVLSYHYGQEIESPHPICIDQIIVGPMITAEHLKLNGPTKKIHQLKGLMPRAT